MNEPRRSSATTPTVKGHRGLLDIVPEHNIDDARDRIGPIHRGRRQRKHFYALNRFQGMVLRSAFCLPCAAEVPVCLPLISTTVAFGLNPRAGQTGRHEIRLLIDRERLL